MRHSLTLLILLMATTALAQEQIDKADPAGKNNPTAAIVSVRVRVTQVAPAQKAVIIQWRHGGEGLGGAVTHGIFTSETGEDRTPLGQWSKPLPLTQVAGKEGAWRFPTIVIATETMGKKSIPLSDISVDFEFSQAGKVVASFTEIGPKGATVGFAVPPYKDPQAFFADLTGLSEHARRRHQNLAKLFPEPAKMPKRFGVIGHLAGYGEGAGYGIRHSNPDIVKEECETLKLLGVNGLVGEDSVKLADAAGAGKEFRRVYWGGPGSGSPMGFVKKRGVPAAIAEAQACPFDPELFKQIDKAIPAAIAEHHRIGAENSWGLWWDEIGVAAKGHIQTCPRCREKFVEYLKQQKIEPAAVGAKSWDDVKPYAIWPDSTADKNTKPAPPAAGPQGLLYYYSFRFLTEATAQLFTDCAKKLKDQNILLYAMQGPTPSWSGHSLDWNEFYDAGANTAFVFETSNRDPRVWQFESYLADIGRGICDRHNIPMGVLIKPHRGAVEQRMLSLISRGAKVIEWYTYGPDYAKGDSFSQSPELLERVAKAARFLGANEEYLYDAKPAVPARVAFCSPRSSEIWGKATDLGVTAFEDAKWVYIALRHANVPVDVLSEQQLADGTLQKYSVLYVVGPNLRKDAGEAVLKWVQAGGRLWTDALGLSRDESGEPAHFELTGIKGKRDYESWGKVEPYKATQLKPFAHTRAPLSLKLGGDVIPLAVGRDKSLNDAEHSDTPSGSSSRYWDRDVKVPGVDSLERKVGNGHVTIRGYWAGLTYSSRVRQDGFDMSKDFDDNLGAQITSIEGHVNPIVIPVQTSLPTVEAVALKKNDRRSIALMNWAYRRDDARGETLIPAQNLKINISGLGAIHGVRSYRRGELKLETKEPNVYSVTLPKLDEIDLLILE
jgi:hypothetical protein